MPCARAIRPTTAISSHFVGIAEGLDGQVELLARGLLEQLVSIGRRLAQHFGLLGVELGDLAVDGRDLLLGGGLDLTDLLFAFRQGRGDQLGRLDLHLFGFLQDLFLCFAQFALSGLRRLLFLAGELQLVGRAAHVQGAGDGDKHPEVLAVDGDLHDGAGGRHARSLAEAGRFSSRIVERNSTLVEQD